jgi:predicted small integral membrane protein
MDGEPQGLFDWMAWTPEVAYFFIAIGVMLLAMGVWEKLSPTVERKGLLPLVTTRGDRLFIGLLALAWIMLGTVGFTDWDPRLALGAGLVLLAALLRWG